MSPQYWNLDTEDQVRHLVAHASMKRLAGEKFRVQVVNDDPKQRTPTQNNALHMWLGQVATTLSDAGFDVRAVLKHDAEIPWSKHAVKEYLWRPVQEAMTGKISTTTANTVEYNDICMAITRHLGQKLGVTLPPWPSYFNEEQGDD